MGTGLTLEERDGLPDALRVLAQDYPRTGWQTHRNFTGMVQFWLDRHLMFRRLLNALDMDMAQHLDGQMDAAQYAPRLSRYGGMLLNELHAHHHIEDSHYFPKLITLDHRIAAGFDLLEADHTAMDGLLHGFATNANAVLQGGDAGELSTYLARFGTLLDRHLTDEEELVVPLILATGFDG